MVRSEHAAANGWFSKLYSPPFDIRLLSLCCQSAKVRRRTQALLDRPNSVLIFMMDVIALATFYFLFIMDIFGTAVVICVYLFMSGFALNVPQSTGIHGAADRRPVSGEMANEVEDCPCHVCDLAPC